MQGDDVPPSERDASWYSKVETPSIHDGSLEFKYFSSLVRKSMPDARVVKLARVQSRGLWKKFSFCRDEVVMNNDGDANERLLFHGTGRTEPGEIISHADGLDPRFSNGGFYGRGVYLSESAAYVCGGRYAHRLDENRVQLLVVRLAAGNSQNLHTHVNSTTKAMAMPGKRDDGSGRLFDSVKAGPHCPTFAGANRGDKDASVIFVSYTSGQMYPAFIVTIELSKRKASTSNQAPSAKRASTTRSVPPLPSGALGATGTRSVSPLPSGALGAAGPATSSTARAKSLVLYREGEHLHRADKTDEALAMFRAAVAVDHTNGDAWFRLGVLQFRTNGYCSEEEVYAYEQAIKCKSSRFLKSSHNNLAAAIFHVRQDYTRAIEEYDNALALDPSFKEAHFSKGVALLKVGKNAESRWHIEKAAQLGLESAKDVMDQLAAEHAAPGEVGSSAQPPSCN